MKVRREKGDAGAGGWCGEVEWGEDKEERITEGVDAKAERLGIARCILNENESSDGESEMRCVLFINFGIVVVSEFSRLFTRSNWNPTSVPELAMGAKLSNGVLCCLIGCGATNHMRFT